MQMNELDLLEQFHKCQENEREEFILSYLNRDFLFTEFRLTVIDYLASKGKIELAKQYLSSTSFESTKENKIRLARYAIGFGMYSISDELITNLLKDDPNGIQILLLQADAYLSQKEKIKSLKIYEKILVLNPSSTAAISKSQSILLKLGKIEKAKENLGKALLKAPNDFHLKLREGELHMYLENHEKANESFKTAIQCAKNIKQEGIALALQIEAESKFSTLEKTIKALELANEKFKGNKSLGIKLFNIYFKKGQFTDCARILDPILRKHPKNKKAIELRAKLLYRQGEFDLAEKLILNLLKTSSATRNSMLILANIYNKTNRIELALQYYQKSLQINPDFAQSYIYYAQLLYEKGQSSKAFVLLSRGLDRVNQKYPLYQKSIQLNINVGNFEHALSMIKICKSEYGILPELLLYEAKIYQRLGYFEKSNRTAEGIRKIDDVDKKWILESKKLMANTRFMMYDYEEAEKIFKWLINELEVPNFERNRLALLLALKGEDEIGLDHLNIATNEVQNEKGKVIVPLTGHVSKVVNELRINPVLLKKLKRGLQLGDKAKLNVIAKIINEDPYYFGGPLFLANELRSQGILDEISARLKESKAQTKIPKVIVQYWNEERLPPEIVHVMRSWLTHNPEFEHKVFSRKTAYDFINENYQGAESKAFLACEHPAMQADYFRLAYLAKCGGFYADADDRCSQSIDPLTGQGADLIIKLGDFGCFSNNFLACSPNNPYLKYTLERGTQNMLTYFNEGPWFRLGPGHLTSCISHIFAQHIEDSDFEHWPKILTLGQSEFRKMVSQHLALSYKRSDKSWFNSEYKKTITKTNSV